MAMRNIKREHVINILIWLNTITGASKINVSDTKRHQLQGGFAPSNYNHRLPCVYL